MKIIRVKTKNQRVLSELGQAVSKWARVVPTNVYSLESQQLQAVEKAITNAKKTLVHDHIDHCLEGTVKDGTLSADDAVREFREITKYL